MTYDPVRRRVLMYGGMANTGEALDDTWEWDGATWSLLDTIEHPPSSEFLTFDTRRGLAVLVGGQPTEHWEWNGVAWILRQPPPFMVSPGMGGSMSYDAALDLTLCAPGGPDLWGWNGSSWTMQRFGPGPGGIVQLAYDAGRMRTVLVGVPDLRVWELVDGTLTEPSREPRPPGRQNFGLVYADQLGVLLFGGMINGSTWFDDTWLWDGTSWRELL